MLHPGIRHFDQLVAVVLEWVLAEVVLKGFEHPLGLRKLLLGLLQVLRQRVEIEGEVAQPVVEMNIVADVERHAVIVDRIAHVPVPARAAVTEVLLADEPPVGNVHELVGNRDAQVHRFDLVAPLVLVGPPDAGALHLARRVDPGPARRVLAGMPSRRTSPPSPASPSSRSRSNRPGPP